MGKEQQSKKKPCIPPRPPLSPEEFFENDPDWIQIESTIRAFSDSPFPANSDSGLAALRGHLFQTFCRNHPLNKVKRTVREIIESGRLSQFRSILIKRLELIEKILLNARFLPQTMVVGPVVYRAIDELSAFTKLGIREVEKAQIEHHTLIRDIESLQTRAQSQPGNIVESDLLLVRRSHRQLLAFHKTAPADSFDDEMLTIREFARSQRISEEKTNLYIDRMRAELKTKPKTKPAQSGQKCMKGESPRKTKYTRTALIAAHTRLVEIGYHAIDQ